MTDYHSLKKCEFCGESIPLEAGRCPYCGSILESISYDSIETDSNRGSDSDANDTETVRTDEAQPGSVNEKAYGAEQVNTDEQGTGEAQDNAYRSTGTTSQHSGWQPQPYRPVTGSYEPMNDKSPLGNGMKVFLTILFTIIPGIGQLAGIITAIVFMNSTDQDRKSFGVAILVASLILFVLSCIGCLILSIAASRAFPYVY